MEPIGLIYFDRFLEMILDEFKYTQPEQRAEVKEKMGIDLYHHLLKMAWPTFDTQTQKFFNKVTEGKSVNYACFIVLETLKEDYNEAIIAEAKKSFYKKLHSRVLILDDD